MPQAPRVPRAPTGRPSPPRLPPLRLSPIRSGGSQELDERKTKSGLSIPPFVRWDKFFQEWQWDTGQHVTIVGPTGSGKTVLARYLLRKAPVERRGDPGPFVVVLGIKNRDKELYGAFQKDGYRRVTKFDPNPDEDVWEERVLYAPIPEHAGTEGRKERAKLLGDALQGIEKAGYWTTYIDDVQYVASQLGLNTELEEIWIKGRSEGLSLMVSSQEPVHIPVMAYGQATHLFLFSNPDLRRAERMAELTGMNREITRETVLQLPDHEFLYVNKSSRQYLRSMVIR